MKISKLAIVLSLLLTSGISNAALLGYSWTNPKKDAKGDALPTQLKNPFSKYLILDHSVYDVDKLMDYPGSVVAVYQDSNGIIKLRPYVEQVLLDDKITPELKLSDISFEAFLLDSKQAIEAGLPLIGNIGAEGNHKFEYKFFISATSSINNKQLDKNKFYPLANAIKAEFSNKKDVQLLSVEVITSAAVLTTSASQMTGVKANAKLNGPGWQIGGMFYRAQSSSSNFSRIGVVTVPFAPELIISSSSTTPTPISKISLSGKQGITILDSQKSLSESNFKNILQIK